MAIFTIRVELHNARGSGDYQLLQKAMAARGMTDVVTSSDGKRWKLPPAEYSYIGDASVQQVVDAARAAATVTGLHHAVLVSECLNRMWWGLEEVRA